MDTNTVIIASSIITGIFSIAGFVVGHKVQEKTVLRQSYEQDINFLRKSIALMILFLRDSLTCFSAVNAKWENKVKKWESQLQQLNKDILKEGEYIKAIKEMALVSKEVSFVYLPIYVKEAKRALDGISSTSWLIFDEDSSLSRFMIVLEEFMNEDYQELVKRIEQSLASNDSQKHAQIMELAIIKLELLYFSLLESGTLLKLKQLVSSMTFSKYKRKLKMLAK